MEEEEPTYQAISQSYADCESLFLFSITPASPAGGLAWRGAAPFFHTLSLSLFCLSLFSQVTTVSVKEGAFSNSGQVSTTGPRFGQMGLETDTWERERKKTIRVSSDHLSLVSHSHTHTLKSLCGRLAVWREERLVPGPANRRSTKIPWPPRSVLPHAFSPPSSTLPRRSGDGHPLRYSFPMGFDFDFPRDRQEQGRRVRNNRNMIS